jgi:glutathione synthase/RimK-type ligase-like ATP-grasp enzyme
MSRIAFLTMDSLADFVSYDQLVLDLLRESGVFVDEVSWRSRSVCWDDYELVVIRSPWDYQQDAEAFLQVLENIERSRATLLNPLSIVRWNIRKHYLRELEQQGISIVPTIWLESPQVSELHDAFEQLGCDELVGKPLVGANADHAHRLSRSSQEAALVEAAAAWAQTTALVQPFVPSIQSEGELSLIWFEGQFSHAVRKVPKAGDFRVQEEHGGNISRCDPPPDVLQLAADCHRVLAERLLYSRVDIVRLPNGRPAVMEMELIEPSLYLAFDAAAPQIFARSIRERLLQIPPRDSLPPASGTLSEPEPSSTS